MSPPTSQLSRWENRASWEFSMAEARRSSAFGFLTAATSLNTLNPRPLFLEKVWCVPGWSTHYGTKDD